MKILAFAASNSRQSINQQLVRYGADQLAAQAGHKGVEQVEIEVLDLNEFEMPLYSLERQQRDGFPAPAQAFLDEVAKADALLISYAEHNGSYSVAYKNVFDWASRIDMNVYQNKPTVLLATSPGPGGARNVLATAAGAAPYFGMDLKGQLSLPSFFDNFDSEKGTLASTEGALDFSTQLDALLAELLSSVEASVEVAPVS